MKKILVIEDEDTVRITIRDLLEASNYKVFTAPDGKEGIQLAIELIPDLIICDIMMPGCTGYDVIDTLRCRPEFTLIPFIFLSAKAEIDDFRTGMERGADDYIMKPFRAQSLLKAIETRLTKVDAIQFSKKDSEGNNKKKGLREKDRFFVKVNNKPQIIKTSDIEHIKANGEYSEVVLINGSKIMIRKSMKQWEEQLPENIFLRIHRATIINIDQIEKIEKWFNRSYLVHLKSSKEEFIISQRYSTKIRSDLTV